MLFKKNLPIWERVTRTLGALVLGFCAFHYGKNAVGITFAAAALITIVTGLIGYCPVCQIGGRKSIA